MYDIKKINETRSKNIYKIINELNKNKEKIRIMHICGTHERTISKYGIRSLLPQSIEVLSGPGCPVCVTPIEDIDSIIILAKKGYIIITYGDMLRVPGTFESLLQARSDGARVEMVYSIDDAITIANKNKNEKYIFFAIGFETTIPTVSIVIKRGLPQNLTIYSSLKLTPSAMTYLIRESNVDAFIAPGHVATIIGIEPFKIFTKLNYPVAITGFEMYDVLKAIYLLKQQIENKKNNMEIKIENEYSRVVGYNGNIIAIKLIDEVFDITDSNWRGIGCIKNSGLKIKKKYHSIDAKILYKNLYIKELLKIKSSYKKETSCICSKILTGKAIPDECPLFMNRCNQSNPIGACMVSDEGMCFNWYKYGTVRIKKDIENNA